MVCAILRLVVGTRVSVEMGINVAVLLAGVLVLVHTLGRLAGSEGLERIPFENRNLANSVGSVAQVLILFEGGLRTTLASVQRVWMPVLVLSSIGVLFTSLITGLALA